MDLTIHFHVEPADRSVGIMSEGFSAWIDEHEWVELVELMPTKFQWYDDGKMIDPPAMAPFVQEALLGFVGAYYSRDI